MSSFWFVTVKEPRFYHSVGGYNINHISNRSNFLMALVLPAAEYTRLPKYDSDEGAIYRPLLTIRGHQNVSTDI